MKRLILAVALAGLLAGCGSTSAYDDEPAPHTSLCVPFGGMIVCQHD